MIKKSMVFLLFLVCLSGWHDTQAQQKKIDSLKTLIGKEPNTVGKTAYLYELGDLFEASHPDSALYYYAAARDFAKAHDFALGEARYASHAIAILNRQGKFKEALILAEGAVETYKKLNSPNNLSVAYLNIGNQWQYLSDFMTASEYYLKAKNIADSLQDNVTQRTINNNLSSVFVEMKAYEKAEFYGLNALELAKENKDPWATLSPLYNLATNEKNQGNYEKALEYINEFEKTFKALGSEFDLVDAFLAKGNILGRSNLDAGVTYLHDAIDRSRAQGFPESEMYGYLYLAEIYGHHKKYNLVVQSIAQGIPMAETLGTRHELSDFHKKASEAHEKLGHFEKALAHNRQYEALLSEIQLEAHKNRLLGLEAKYQVKQKEAQIRSLNAERESQILKIKQKNAINYAFAVLLLVVGIIGFLVYKNYQSKQKIQAQRIHELETEKQLFATQALLQGQEDERSRMAKELHDGLGGLLSGVKLNLNTMQKKLIITEEDGAAFEKSILLLDESISELRRVAHNLMPESILKYGLDGAINEYLQSIQNEQLNIIYQSYHIENGLGKQLVISVYRIVQELVNNILKHAEATEILVQVRKDESLLVLDVEDNGTGFDYQSDTKAGGMGLTGIQSRVHYWKGSLSIQSDLESGTAVHIEIPMQS